MAVQFVNNPKVGDNVKIEVGDSSDLQIYHDATNSYVKTTSGNLIIQKCTANYFFSLSSFISCSRPFIFLETLTISTVTAPFAMNSEAHFASRLLFWFSFSIRAWLIFVLLYRQCICFFR